MPREPNQDPVDGRVLIAEDDPDFRGLLVRRATKLGLSIVEASDGSEALEAVEQQPFDLLLVDLYMPGHTGLEVIQAAQRIDPDLQAILLTGSATLESAVEALRTGVYDYLTKPLHSLAAFDLSVKRALRHRYLIKENARLFAEVERLAVTDPLTGLYNRHKLNESLEIEVERARRYGRPLSVIMIDLDGLKRINDTHGHPAGDAVLRGAAQAISTEVRRVDLATRYGGDEFLVLLPEADLEEAAGMAERICERIIRTEFQGESLSASAGVAEWAPAHDSAADFLEAVDQALYQAKGTGEQQVWRLVPEPAG
ncbi:MAG: diguanylate cyclase [Anaerolineae bacterium]